MTLKARFLNGSQGALFAVDRRPARDGPGKAPAIILAPFAEEMNRARRFMTVLAERLASDGRHACILDVYGTGDSAGEFAQASWDGWIEDVRRGCRALAEEHKRLPWIIGIRTGALLAREAAEGEDSAGGVVFLQPVTNGKRFLQQILRTRIAANMRRGVRETTTDLTDRLAAGECLTVGGYSLPATVALPLAERAVREMRPPSCRVLWYEIAQTAEGMEDRRVRPPDTWQARIAADRVIIGDPFWQIEEPPAVPQTVIDTVAQDLEEHAR